MFISIFPILGKCYFVQFDMKVAAHILARGIGHPEIEHNRMIAGIRVCFWTKLILSLPSDTPSDSVLQIAGWESIFHIYKLTLIKFFYNVEKNLRHYSLAW